LPKIIKAKKWLEHNLFFIIVILFLIIWCDMFLLREINLVSADLGRHIENGKLFLKDSTIPHTNLFSYTHPDFPFIAHHWGSGVIFFATERFFGMNGLSFFYVALNILTFFIFFRVAQKCSNFYIATAFSFLVIPLIGERTEIRPEVFSFLFSGIFFWILWKFKKNELSWKWLLFLPILEMIWINLHVYFFLGIAITGVFFLEELVKFFIFKKIGYETESTKIKALLLVIIFNFLFSFINPFGAKGVFYPLNIFQNYGYMVLENQSVWFLENLGFIQNPNFLLYKIVILAIIASFIFLIFINRQKFSLSLFIFAVSFGTIGGLAIRNLSLFGFFALPILSYNTWEIIKKKFPEKKETLKLPIFVLAIAIFAVTFFTHKTKFNSSPRGGLYSKINASAEFFKKENIQGPIFNDYDIGSYLIYHLYPEEKVFVDNRPEAYPASFFEDVYIPVQEDNNKWKETDGKYNFNAIFFYVNDATPWGQKFLIERVSDPNWAPVYVDSFAIIFLKRNEKNGDLIGRFEIPSGRFSVKNK